VAQTCPRGHWSSAKHSSCTQKPPFTQTRRGGVESTCSRHCPTGPQLPHGAPASGQAGPCAIGALVVVANEFVVVTDVPSEERSPCGPAIARTATSSV